VEGDEDEIVIDLDKYLRGNEIIDEIEVEIPIDDEYEQEEE
jgi:hypothetical protein